MEAIPDIFFNLLADAVQYELDGSKKVDVLPQEDKNVLLSLLQDSYAM